MTTKEFFIILLTDKDGKFSLMRITKFAALTTTFIVWAAVSVETGVVHDIPDNLAYINMTLILGKAIQSLGGK